MKYLLASLFTISWSFNIAQSVGVGTNDPDPSAMLEVSSVTQGMLVPRMTSAQRESISNPAAGLLVFDVTSGSFWFHSTEGWIELLDDFDIEVHRVTGNHIYLGLSDYIGMGVSIPLNKLDIKSSPIPRTGIHAEDRPLYVTGQILESSAGVEFRHDNGTQGIGFGFNTIYATGSNTDQDLGLAARGASGNLIFKTNGTERMKLTGDGILQFPLTLANRKLVLYQSTDNMHQFYGLGINAGVMRYQVDAPVSDHVFYAAVDMSTSKELMRITGTGEVGIGISDPAATLDVMRGNAYQGTARLKGTTFDSHFNYASDEHTFIRGGKEGSHVILNDVAGLANVGIGTNNPIQKLHVAGAAYVSDGIGIGVTTPHAPLQLSNATQNRKIILYEAANNDHQFFGFGVNPDGSLRYQTAVNVNDHVFYAAANATSSSELMRIKGNGNVGIGISAPNHRFSVLNKFGVDGNGSLHFHNTPRLIYFFEDGVASKMILSHSPSFPTWGLQYVNNNRFRFLADSAAVMTVNLQENNVEVHGSLKVGYVQVWSDWVTVPGIATGSAQCNCPEGMVVISGGYQISGQYNYVNKNIANTSTSWYVEIWNNAVLAHDLQAFAICARLAN